MNVWSPVIELDSRSELPVFLQIARAIASDVRRGRLGSKVALPSTRELAKQLSVNRNTVSAAYAELRSEGWLQGGRGSRLHVAESLPETHAGRGHDVVKALGFSVETTVVPAGDAHVPRGLTKWDFGAPDPRLVPVDALGRAFRRACRRRSLLDYDRYRPLGPSALQRELASMVSSRRGVVIEPERLVLTRGAHMAVALVAQALIRPGDVVVVEQPGYFAAWPLLRQQGAKLHSIEVDAQGMRVDQLTRLLARGTKVRAVLVTPHHQFPTGAVLSPARRIELLELARRHRFAILEDDFDPDFHYEGRPVLPLMAADRAGVVVSIGSLSKVFAPSVRVGYVLAPPVLAQELQLRRRSLDPQRDELLDAAMAELMHDGELQRHLNRARRVYQARRDALVESLSKQLGHVLAFTPPPGGLAVWAQVREDVDVEPWAERALAAGLQVRTGRLFWIDGKARPFLRLGFSRYDPQELRGLTARLAAALPVPRRRSR